MWYETFGTLEWDEYVLVFFRRDLILQGQGLDCGRQNVHPPPKMYLESECIKWQTGLYRCNQGQGS